MNISFIRRIYAVARSITERKQTEDALRKSESRLKVRNEDLENIVVQRTQEIRELSKALTVVVQRERRRMSHLLHEDLLQILLSSNLQMEFSPQM